MRYVWQEMAQLDAADSMPSNWLGLGLWLVNNNLKVKLLKVSLASSWPGIELAWHGVGGIEAYPTLFSKGYNTTFSWHAIYCKCTD